MDTARHILEVSYKLFVEKGYEATNIREICKEVGVGMPTIYYHFQSKENLFYKAYDEYSLKYLQYYENLKIINENIDTEKKLFALFKGDIEYIIANETEFKFHVRYKFFPPVELKEELKKKEIMYIGRKEKVIMKIINEGVNEEVFNEADVNNLVKVYKKFVFDNLIGVIFFQNSTENSAIEKSWKSFVNCLYK